MPFQPGSDQYPGVTPLQNVIPFAVLPQNNVDVCGEIYCVGMGRVTLLCQYQKDETPPNGQVTYLGTGVVMTIWLSPYALDAQVPGGESEWWPISVIAPKQVEGCQVNLAVGETASFAYCGVALDDTLETFTYDVSLPTHAQRLRVCAQEVARGTEGFFGCHALLSLDPGGEFGWTIKTTAWSQPG